VRDLTESEGVDEVVVADLDGSRAREAAGWAAARSGSNGTAQVSGLALDAGDGEALRRAFDGADVVCNCAVHATNLPVMEACADAGTHYVDLGGLYHTTRRQLALHDRFVAAGVTAVVGMGGSPGTTNVLAALAGRDLEVVEEVEVRLGVADFAPSAAPVPVPYAIQTILDEFAVPAVTFRDGRLVEVPAMSEQEELDFPPPVGRVRVGHTLHSEVATLPLHFADRGIRSVSFKVGFPAEFMDRLALLTALGLADTSPVELPSGPVVPRELLVHCITRPPPCPAPRPPRTTPRRSGSGCEGDGPDLRGIRPSPLAKTPRTARRSSGWPSAWSGPTRPGRPGAGQLDTGVPPSIVAQFLATKLIDRPGVLAPEDAVPPEPFLAELAARSMEVTVITREPAQSLGVAAGVRGAERSAAPRWIRTTTTRRRGVPDEHAPGAEAGQRGSRAGQPGAGGAAAAAVARGVATMTPVYAAAAHGAVLEDVDGNRFIDFTGGLGVLNAGHTPPSVVQAVKDQVERYLHTCQHAVMNEPYVAVAEALNRITPGDYDKRTLLVNSGAEATENVVKIARAATGRPGVVVFDNAFHGRTLLALAMTGKVTPYKQGYQPFPSEVYRVPYAYCYRCPFHLTYPDCGIACADYVEEEIKVHVGPQNVACLIVEPVQGEGGFIAPPPGWLERIADMCRRLDIPFVADEVQSGFGRTGTLFATEQHPGVVPDFTLSAKSIAAGLPLAAVTGRAELMDAPGPGRARRHLRRQPAGLRGRAGHHRAVRAGRPAGAGPADGRHPGPAPARAGRAAPGGGRGQGPGGDDGHGAGHRPGDQGAGQAGRDPGGGLRGPAGAAHPEGRHPRQRRAHPGPPGHGGAAAVGGPGHPRPGPGRGPV
jgi:4-aminobutyrate aminotransferase